MICFPACVAHLDINLLPWRLVVPQRLELDALRIEGSQGTWLQKFCWGAFTHHLGVDSYIYIYIYYICMLSPPPHELPFGCYCNVSRAIFLLICLSGSEGQCLKVNNSIYLRSACLKGNDSLHLDTYGLCVNIGVAHRSQTDLRLSCPFSFPIITTALVSGEVSPSELKEVVQRLAFCPL